MRKASSKTGVALLADATDDETVPARASADVPRQALHMGTRALSGVVPVSCRHAGYPAGSRPHPVEGPAGRPREPG
jgi:hypothetical protein